MSQLTIAYAEDSLPIASLEQRLAAVKQWGLALEIANRGAVSVEPYQQVGVSIAAVQAYRMHDFHPLHRDPEHRYQAISHVEDTLTLAAQLHAPRIVTVCGFGHHLADRPFERSLEFFARVAGRAKALGVRILIEPLSPKRLGAMAHPEEVARLMTCLNQPEVFSLVLDTGHLLDSGFGLADFLSTWPHPVEELQLKGRNSAPPDMTMLSSSWLAALRTRPSVVCVEHRQPITWEGFETIAKWLQQMRAAWSEIKPDSHLPS